VAMGAAQKYTDLDAVAACQMLVVLDGVEDPHKPGRHHPHRLRRRRGAVVIPERRAVGVTDVVAKAAAGALEHLPVVRVTNINRRSKRSNSAVSGSTAWMSAAPRLRPGAVRLARGRGARRRGQRPA